MMARVGWYHEGGRQFRIISNSLMDVQYSCLVGNGVEAEGRENDDPL